MKKFISIALSMVLLVCGCGLGTVAIGAGATANVYSQNMSADAGEIVKVPVYIGGNSGLLGLKLTFDYDPAVLSPVNVEYGPAMSYGIQDNIEGDSVPGSMNVYWAGSEDVKANGIWFYINFRVLSTAPSGDTVIDISYSQADTFNENFEDVVLSCQSATVTVSNSAYSQNATFSCNASNVVAGNGMVMYVKADTISNAGELIFNFTYDERVFTFAKVQGVKVTAKAEAGDGNVRITVKNSSGASSGDNLFMVYFTCIDNAVSGKYTIEATATAGGQEAFCSPCQVIVTNPASGGSVIYADSVYALQGQTVAVPVYIANNTGVMGFRLNFSYNENVLTPVSVTKGALLEAGTLSDSIGAESGSNFSVLWNHTDEVKEDGELFTITFQVASGISYSTADVAVAYSQEDTFNEKYEDVNFICEDIGFAITNLVGKTEKVSVKPTEGYIISEVTACSDISKILGSVAGTTVSCSPIAGTFCGTGSDVFVKNSSSKVLEEYKLVVLGDINGDSACDVLDTMGLQKVIVGKDTCTDAHLVAVDFDENGYADINDYQSLINRVVSE